MLVRRKNFEFLSRSRHMHCSWAFVSCWKIPWAVLAKF